MVKWFVSTGAGTGEGGGSASVGGPVDPSLSHTSLISATQLDLKVLLAYSILPQVGTRLMSRVAVYTTVKATVLVLMAYAILPQVGTVLVELPLNRDNVKEAFWVTVA
jgi:NADH:ubiquinone oxidoreductase subunit 2 (subunit N)